MNLLRLPSQKLPRYESIQALRGGAALLVVLFHLGVMPNGHTGVDLFFVISGFIMGAIGVDERPLRFVYRRVTRIAPLYWAVTLAMCVLFFVPGLMRNFSFTSEQLIKSLLFIPYFDNAGELYPLVVPGWTLNFEMFFYLVFAAALFTPWPRRATMGVLVALTAVGLVMAPTRPFALVATSPLVLEFAAGLFLSRWSGTIPARVGMILAAIGFAALAAVMVGIVMPGEGLRRVVAAGLPSAALLAGVLSLEAAGRWPRLPAAVFLGNISYSLYLTHGLVLPLVEKFAPENVLLLVPVGMAASIALAALTFRAFEQPSIAFFRRIENRFLRRRDLATMIAQADSGRRAGY